MGTSQRHMTLQQDAFHDIYDVLVGYACELNCRAFPGFALERIIDFELELSFSPISSHRHSLFLHYTRPSYTH